MSRARQAIFLLVPALLAGVDGSFAHHAASGLYDRDGSITVSGRVESLFWRNPHVRFTLIVADDDGSEQLWEIEAGSVNSLERMDVSESVLTPGSVVEVTGLPGRDSQPIAYARSIVSATGEQVPIFFDINDLGSHYELERDDSAADGSGQDLFRVWIPVRLPNTGSGRVDFPLTEAARAARADWNPANDPALRCVPPGMPAAMDNPYPIEFEDRGDTIVLRLEEWDGVRIIHMGADAGPDAPSPMGYSVGKWEDDALVVETSRIDYPYFDDLGTPQSDQMRIVERFSLDDSGDRLFWRAEVTDPLSFTEAVELEIEWRFIPGVSRKAFNCALPAQDD